MTERDVLTVAGPAYLSVRRETLARAEALLQTERTMGMDSLINLALDAYALLSGVGVDALVKRMDAVRAGSHYCEL